jgi:hypothetical protein
LGARQRLPFFAHQPAGIIALGHVNSFLIGAALSIRPRDSGGGGPPEGRWRGRGQQRNFDNARLSADQKLDDSFHVLSNSILSAFIVLQRQRSSESCAPSTTVRSLRELQWSPSPAIAGADGASDLVPATHLRPSFADQSHEAFASKK